MYTAGIVVGSAMLRSRCGSFGGVCLGLGQSGGEAWYGTAPQSVALPVPKAANGTTPVLRRWGPGPTGTGPTGRRPGYDKTLQHTALMHLGSVRSESCHLSCWIFPTDSGTDPIYSDTSGYFPPPFSALLFRFLRMRSGQLSLVLGFPERVWLPMLCQGRSGTATVRDASSFVCHHGMHPFHFYVEKLSFALRR